MLLIVTVGVAGALFEAVLSGWLWQTVALGIGFVFLLYMGKDVWRVCASQFALLRLDLLALGGVLFAFVMVDYYAMSAYFFVILGFALYFVTKRLANCLQPMLRN